MRKKLYHSGFVYIWYDRKHKRYYVGSHWGPDDDGYICSSSWMNKAYKQRPHDFKRRIIARIYTSKKDLLIEENRWLQMIKPEEMKIRYYNLINKSYDHWSADEKRRLEIGNKISKANAGKCPNWTDPEARGKNISKGKKQKIQEKGGFSEEHRKNISKGKTGFKHTEEWKKHNSERMKQQWASGIRNNKTFLGKTHTPEAREKIKKANIGKIHTDETKEKLSVRKNFIVDGIEYSNLTRLELCEATNISPGSYYYMIKKHKIIVQ